MKEGYRKLWFWGIRIICILSLVFPISITFFPGELESDGEWLDNYVLNTFEYAILIIPLIAILTLMPRMKTRSKKYLIVISVIISLICFLWALISIVLPIQDFIPQLGTVVILFLFPIVIINSFMEWNNKIEL